MEDAKVKGALIKIGPSLSEWDYLNERWHIDIFFKEETVCKQC